MYNHNKAQQSKNRVHISWDILYIGQIASKKTWAGIPALINTGWGRQKWTEGPVAFKSELRFSIQASHAIKNSTM